MLSLTYKLVLIGDSSVGKSAILNRYINNDFDENFITTIGIDFGMKIQIFGNKEVEMQIWTQLVKNVLDQLPEHIIVMLMVFSYVLI